MGFVSRTGNDGGPGAQLLSRVSSWRPTRFVAFARPPGDHFHGTYAYEKSVTRHYAGKFRQHHSRVDSTRRGASRETGQDEEKKRLFPLHPLPDHDAFLSSVRFNENVMHWQF